MAKANQSHQVILSRLIIGLDAEMQYDFIAMQEPNYDDENPYSKQPDILVCDKETGEMELSIEVCKKSMIKNDIEKCKKALMKAKNLLHEISKMPNIISFEGVHFEFQLKREGAYFHFYYPIFWVEESSPHYKTWCEFKCWKNPYSISDGSGFIYLSGSILTQTEFIEEIKDCLIFLEKFKDNKESDIKS